MRIGNPLCRSIQIKATAGGNIRRVIKQIEGVDYAAYGSAIQHCTNNCLVRQAKQLHARLVMLSVVPDNFLASKLINFYAKSNYLCEARKVFDAIPQKNIFSWNAMIIGYSLRGVFHDALKLFSSLAFSTDVTPDHFTVTGVLKALASSYSNSNFAKEIHCFVLRQGLDWDICVVNSLITYYSRCDKLGLARTIFDTMPNRDLVSWNSMIAGYSQSGFYGECKQLYLHMLDSAGLSPNEVTLVSVLQACGQSNDLIFGIEVHRLVNEGQIKMDISLCNALIGMYAKCGSLDYALELFEGMSERDGVSYSSIISGYMVYGFVHKALAIFREMKNPGLSVWNAVISGMAQNNHHEQVLDLVQEMHSHGSRPNTVTLSSILPTISYCSNLRAGKEIHSYAIRRSYDQNIYVATAIIDTYAKLGFIHGAQRVFDQSEDRSLILWTAIISAYSAHGNANLALHLYNEMLDIGILPDPVTLTAVLSACAHSGLVDEAWKIFDSMSSNYGIQPLVEHHACMVSVLSRAGRLSEAAQFISKMSIKPSAKVWGALLNGASVHGDVEMGKFACDHLFEIEPENTGNYVIMANLYSKAGKWEEADKVRERMKQIGLKKIRGSSWI
ncbi:hypothetical protein L6164_009849 [Bauhinia variegata]|uniref:Uncharacterized protein n=1 Tax=Bauhinia variegata TaxID=167791 RepID=A0ACB9PME4_BAUVA|nr:hypothetical protein L6164_009849 [Bauhinia variegata]